MNFIRIDVIFWNNIRMVVIFSWTEITCGLATKLQKNKGHIIMIRVYVWHIIEFLYSSYSSIQCMTLNARISYQNLSIFRALYYRNCSTIVSIVFAIYKYINVLSTKIWKDSDLWTFFARYSSEKWRETPNNRLHR